MPYAPNQRCSQGHVRRVGSLASEAVSAVVSSIYTHSANEHQLQSTQHDQRASWYRAQPLCGRGAHNSLAQVAAQPWWVCRCYCSTVAPGRLDRPLY